MPTVTTAPSYMTPHAHADHEKFLVVKELSFRYGPVTALNDVSFDLCEGERSAVVGPNGAGKSTLFKLIVGLLPPTSGSVRFRGRPAGERPPIASVPQRNEVDWRFPLTVRDVVMMGRTAHIGLLRRPSVEDRRVVEEALAHMRLDTLAHRQIGELSGGQQQRMFIAQALAQQAEMVLMDEPLNGLDLTAQQDVYEVLDYLRQRNVTVFVSTHDLDEAARHFDRVMLLNCSLLDFDVPPRVFTPELLTAAYGAGLRLVQTDEGFLLVGEGGAAHG